MSNFPIKRIVIHCTATREGAKITLADIRRWHTDPKSKGGRGWNDIGYQYIIFDDGKTEKGRPDNVPGAGVAGFNTGSIHIVYTGGLDANGKPKDTRTSAQRAAMRGLIRTLRMQHPKADVMGHRDLSPDKDGDGVIERHEWLKDCPCFDVRAWVAAGMPSDPAL
jgi:N-acetylmuramoyl-L-alanine amidase